MIKFDKRIFFVTFCILPFIRPDSLNLVPGVTSFYYVYRILAIIFIFLYFLLKKQKINKFSWLWIIFEGWILSITLINSGNIVYALFQALTITAIALLFQIYHQDILVLLKSIYNVLTIFVLINFASIILFPKGMYTTGITNLATQNWFLGFKNGQTAYFLPLIGLIFIFSKLESFTWKKAMLLLILIVSSIITDSSTLLVALAVFLIITLLPGIKRRYNFFNIYTYVFATISLFILVPILRLQNIFSFIIENILKKNLTLTNRTEIWDNTIAAIIQRPLSGYGEQVNTIRNALYDSSSIISAHNQILEYLYTGGLILILIYLIINIEIARRIGSYKSKDVIQVVSALYLCLQIALLTEVFTETSIFMAYFIIWYSKDLIFYEVEAQKSRRGKIIWR